MLKRALLGTAVVGVAISLFLGAAQIVPMQVTGALVTASVGIPSLAFAYLSTKEKKSPEESKQLNTPSTTGFIRLAQVRPEPKTVVEETAVLEANEYIIYDFDLKKGEKLVGGLSSDEAINYYCLSRYGLKKFENHEEFSFDYGSEGILKGKVEFPPPRAGTWYLVVDNEGKSRATVTVHLLVKARET
jgi:hypothetical protein